MNTNTIVEKLIAPPDQEVRDQDEGELMKNDNAASILRDINGRRIYFDDDDIRRFARKRLNQEMKLDAVVDEVTREFPITEEGAVLTCMQVCEMYF